jgi:sec-independent protein translocase protein TatB
MEILGVGPMELILILIIALIILGPNDMVKAGKTIGRTMRSVIKSPQWAAFSQISRGVRTLPNRLMREAGLEEEMKDLRQTQDELRQQVNEVMKIKAPFVENAQEIDREVRSIGSELGDWTVLTATPKGESNSAGTAVEPAGLSAWTSPPPAETASPPSAPAPADAGRDDNGQAEIYPPRSPSSPES